MNICFFFKIGGGDADGAVENDNITDAQNAAKSGVEEAIVPGNCSYSVDFLVITDNILTCIIILKKIMIAEERDLLMLYLGGGARVADPCLLFKSRTTSIHRSSSTKF